jgi:hypothetical protein
VEVVGVFEDLLDSLDSRAVEGVVKLSDVVREGSTVGRGCVDRLRAVVLVVLEFVEAMPGVAGAMGRVGEVVACGVDFGGAPFDGSVVASGPPPARVLFEFGLGSAEAPLGGCLVAGSGDEFVASGVVVVAAVRWNGGVERRELVAEMSSCDT